MAPPPSGDQTVIAHEDQVLTVVEVGGGIRTYQVGGIDVLDGYAEDAMCPAARGQILWPWPNRILGGAYDFAGVRNHLSLTEPAAGNAIHGLTRFASWAVDVHERSRARLVHRLHPQPGYPFTLDLAVDYALGAEGLTVGMRATNVGPSPCPFGAGAHPYLTAPPGTAVHCPAATMLVDGARRPADTGGAHLDNAFTDLARGPDGRARTSVGDATLWVGAAFSWLMLYRPEAPSLAVEPMTCPPDAFRTGVDLIVLEPGGVWTGEWGISSR